LPRLFVAIEIEDNSTLSRIIGVRDRISGLGVDLKPVEDENIHLTLRFLGDVEDSLVPSIYRAVDELSSFGSFVMRVRGLGAFPNTKNPRVVWVGVADGSEILRSMRSALDRGLRGLRVHEDEHAFHPHITIARVRGRSNLDILSRYIEENIDLEFGLSPVTKVVLKKSTLTPRGPIYSDLRVVALSSPR
jgi:2'-5' RNA ligase